MRHLLEDKNPAEIPIVSLWVVPEPKDSAKLQAVRDNEPRHSAKSSRLVREMRYANMAHNRSIVGHDLTQSRQRVLHSRTPMTYIAGVTTPEQ